MQMWKFFDVPSADTQYVERFIKSHWAFQIFMSFIFCRALSKAQDDLDLVSKFFVNTRTSFKLQFRLFVDAKVVSVQNPNLNVPIFLPAKPLEILAERKQNNVPLIMGAMR